MKTAINDIKIVTVGGIVHGSVEVDGGIITKISKTPLDGGYPIDGTGKYLIPGFIDMHCHGGLGLDFIDCTAEEMEVLAMHHLMHGTTTMLATTLTATEKTINDCLKTFGEYKKANPDGTLLGVHMEGPWFSPEQSGAQDPHTMKKPNAEELEKIKKEYPFVLRVSAAPELEGGMEFGLKAKELGIVASVGHTDADFDTVVEASENGYSLMTHFYSGMKGVTRVNTYRVAGAVDAGYYLDDMNVEIIADGKHLPQSLLKLIYKLKGVDKISLITDATRGCGLPEGTQSFIGPKEAAIPMLIENGVAILKDRTAFAGSTATFDRLYRTMADAIGKDLVALSKMASYNPAKILGLNDRGEIAEGKRADLIVMDENLNVEKIIYKGNIVK